MHDFAENHNNGAISTSTCSTDNESIQGPVMPGFIPLCLLLKLVPYKAEFESSKHYPDSA